MLGETDVSYHRHAYRFMSLEESLTNNDPKIPFSYCVICKCVPTSFMARTPDFMAYDSDSDSDGNAHEPYKTHQRG